MNNLKFDKEKLVDFVGELVLDYPLHGVLQVGSSARGYALPDSDIDMMAFYNTKGELNSYLTDTSFEGTRLTIEHCDYNKVLRTLANYRQSIPSLRQLLKIRDSLEIVEADKTLRSLINISKSACLDSSVLLHSLYLFCIEWENSLKNIPVDFQRPYLLRWTELFVTLEVLTVSGAPAYSKQKWLYKTLLANKKYESIELLRALESLTPELISEMYTSLKILTQNYPLNSFSEEYHETYCTIIRDAVAMVEHDIMHSGPAFRFAASIFSWLIYKEDVMDVLNKGSDDQFFTLTFKAYNSALFTYSNTLEQFLSYVRRLAITVCDQFELEWSNRSNPFGAYFLYTYAVPNLMPCTYKGLDFLHSEPVEPLVKYRKEVREWCKMYG